MARWRSPAPDPAEPPVTVGRRVVRALSAKSKAVRVPAHIGADLAEKTKYWKNSETVIRGGPAKVSQYLFNVSSILSVFVPAKVLHERFFSIC